MNDLKEICTYIRSGEFFSAPQVNIYDVLKDYHMEKLFIVCKNRILREIGADGNHITTDCLNRESLLLDCTGLMLCEDILTAYIGAEPFTLLFDYLHNESEIISAKNDLILLFQNADTKDLKNLVKFSRNKEHICMAKAEIKARKFWNRAVRKARKDIMGRVRKKLFQLIVCKGKTHLFWLTMVFSVKCMSK